MMSNKRGGDFRNSINLVLFHVQPSISLQLEQIPRLERLLLGFKFKHVVTPKMCKESRQRTSSFSLNFSFHDQINLERQLADFEVIIDVEICPFEKPPQQLNQPRFILLVASPPFLDHSSIRILPKTCNWILFAEFVSQFFFALKF